MDIKTKLKFIFIALLISGCKEKNAVNKFNSDNEVDSIRFYYQLSKNKQETATKRLKDITKAYQLSSNTGVDSLIIKTLSYKTQHHYFNKQLDSALVYSNKLLKIATSIKDSSAIGKAYFKLGFYNYKRNYYDSAFYYYNQSKNIFEALNDSIQVGRRLLNMAIIQSDKGDFVGSDETAINALKALQNSSDSTSLASVQNCLAITARKLGQYNDARYRYNEAIKTAPNIYNKLTYACNKANVFIKQNDYDRAIAILDSIKNIDLVHSNLRLKARIIDNRAYALWKKTNNINLIRDFEDAYKIRKQTDDYYGQIASNAHFIEYYQKINAEKVNQYAMNMYKVAVTVNSTEDKLTALKHLILTCKDNSRALKLYSGQYVKLADSLNRARNMAKNQFIKVKYENQKNRETNYRLKNENFQKQLELERSNRAKTMYLFTFILLMLVFYFVYRQRRLLHKKEKMKKVIETENRISKTIHDELANEVYHVMAKLETEPVNNDVMDKLEHIYLKTRDISKSLGIIDVKSGYSEQLRDLFLSYQSEQTKIMVGNLSKINWQTISKLKKITLYRVLQELLTNMKKHSNANNVYINFSQIEGTLIVKYSDNGVGCNLLKGNGIQSMENRIETIKGQIKFETQIAKGFKVLITM